MSVRHVQTELPDALYADLARVAQREGRPLKDVAREAIEAYVRAAEDPSNDPLFELVGAGGLEASDWSERKDWRTARGGSD